MKKIFFLVTILTLTFIFVGCPSGQKPLPPVVSGPLVVMPGIADTFSAVSTDPDGDNIKYQFDWGNGEISEWSTLLASGSVYKVVHTYTNKGIYSVKAKARDQKGKTSEWSNLLSVACGLGILRWTFTCPDQEDFNSTPAIDNQDNIYAGCYAGHIHSVNANGQVRWQYDNGTAYEFDASPAIAPNGNIYACDGNGVVHCINPNNGSQIWSRTVGYAIVATPAVGANNEVYVNSDDGFLYAINAQGQELWHQSAGGVSLSSPAIDANKNIYVGSDDGHLYSYDSLGNLRWRYYVGDEISSSPAIMPNGKICFGANDGYFYILNPDSTLYHAENLIDEISTSPVIGTDSAIYITTEGGKLVRLDPDGNYDWDFPTEGDYTSSPAVVRYSGISGDIIYFKVNLVNKRQSDVDSLYMIKSDGTRFAAASIFPVGGLPDPEIVSSPTVGNDGTIYIGGGVDFDSEQGGLFALSGRGTVASSSWPLFRHDTKNTGRVQ